MHSVPIPSRNKKIMVPHHGLHAPIKKGDDECMIGKREPTDMDLSKIKRRALTG